MYVCVCVCTHTHLVLLALDLLGSRFALLLGILLVGGCNVLIPAGHVAQWMKWGANRKERGW